jgi:Cu/Ag efflux pump CusA
MNRTFNISEWALAHRSFVWFLVIIIVAAGGLSYLRLGRNEDPNFTIKTMVVQVIWPGANITDTLEQITDLVEKKLQETPGLSPKRRCRKAPVHLGLSNASRSSTAAPLLAQYPIRRKTRCPRHGRTS